MNEVPRTDYALLLRRSLRAIEELEEELAATRRSSEEPVAIVGIGCRFPGGVDDARSFWELLREGRDAITEVPKSRWDVDEVFDPDPDAQGKIYTRWGGFLGDVEHFDAAFFGVSPREAVALDPQQRLLLEVTWQSLEDAGISPASLTDSQTAIYVGISGMDYSVRRMEAIGARTGDFYAGSGTAHSMAAGRLSYVLGLHGPNLPIDTACSSSLVAMHLALGALRNREADVAIAGGVNVILSPVGTILTCRGRMMSYEGRCKAFDESADGYVRSEGCAMVVLKRLADAERDGDHILALLRGSAVNHDGRSAGLTVPSGPAQEAVIRAALADARLSPGSIGYLEAHGTGTALGDPIEVKAIDQVFGGRPADRPLLLGSVKTNIGHTEATAGVAGFIKAVLALQHRAIPPHLHLRTPNPHIPWDRVCVAVPTSLVPWESAAGAPRRAGVSAFGFSGTNAHVVLEEAPLRGTEEPVAGPQLLVLSAQTPLALGELARGYVAMLEAPEAPPLSHVAATAALGRTHFAERLTLVADDASTARATLAAAAAGDFVPGVARGRASGVVPEVVFLFTGQGSQRPGMTQRLIETEPVFREAMELCDALLQPQLGHSLLEVLRAGGDGAERIDDTAWTQPALFAVEYALTRLWASWGVEPIAVMGHSVGEYVAACVAGVFSLEDGLRVIVARGRLMSLLPREGSMVAVFADEATVRRAIAPHERWVSIAATNGPRSTVVSGRTDVVQEVMVGLAAAGVESQRLKVSHAFHSPLMEPMLDAFEAELQSVRFSPPRIGLVSNVTGRLAGEEVCNAAYWRRHVMAPVRFMESIDTLQREGYRLHVEIGPTPILLGMAQRCEVAGDSSWVPSLRKACDEQVSMLQSAGELHVRGVPLRWTGIMGERARRRRASLPAYPFQKQRYWEDFEPLVRRAEVASTGTGHPLLGDALESPLRIFQGRIGVSVQPWLADHRILDLTLLPAAAFLEIALAAARHAVGPRVRLRDIVIREGLPLADDGSVLTQVIATPTEGTAWKIEVFSREASEDAAEPWRLHASAVAEHENEAPPAAVHVAGFPTAGDPVDVAGYFERLKEGGAEYGPAFRGIRQMVRAGNEVFGEVQLPDALAGDAGRMHLHPALLDACLQLVGIGIPRDDDQPGDDEIWVPVGVDQYRVFVDGAITTWCHTRVSRSGGDTPELRSDLTLYDEHGTAIAEVTGLRMRRPSSAALTRSAANCLYAIEWPEHPAETADTPLTGLWLVCADATGIGRAIAARLEARGASVVLAWQGDAFASSDDGWRVDPADAGQVRRLVSEVGRDDLPLQGVVTLWALDAVGRGLTLEALERAQAQVLGSTLHLVQALADAGAPLWVVTRGAQAVAGVEPDLAQAPVWGLAGVIASEYPALRAVRVDLDPEARPDDADLLLAELQATGGEDRVALRTGRRHVARLAPAAHVAHPSSEPHRLEITERGTLDKLTLQPMQRQTPQAGEVEIRVVATGLNFRDVLNALGMYPGDPGPLGNECAGVITAIGADVHDLRVGDEVIAMVDSSFATFVIAPADLTVRKPANLTFAEAATIPVTFLTADYALRDLAGIRKGERVLVHAATGGVGMAALQLARRAGAEVYGTAGTAAKRTLALSLGAAHVGDSRSLGFAEDVRRATGGEGVDVVLNSLAGDFIPASLSTLRDGGRFVEIGRTEVWDAARVEREFPGVVYCVLYLGDLAASQPRVLRQRLQELLADFETGALKPLPHRTWPIEEAEKAFRFMGQGRHTGKIVITQSPDRVMRPDATYLITGGLGGLGLACASWLASEGARHLVLMGRRAPSVDANATIARLEASGVEVVVAEADVADAGQLAAVLERCARNLPPLRGILHAAGVLDDGTLPNQELSRFTRVMAPKVRGTWHLHALTADLPLDFFVLFSSVAAIAGPPGQGNYAAANAFMDAFAHVAHAGGLPVLSINWGAWSDVGMAAGLGEQHRRRSAAMGLQLISPEEGVRMLQVALRSRDMPQVAVLPIVRSRLPAGSGPFFSRLRELERSARTAGSVMTPLSPRLASATEEERHQLVTAFLIEQVAKVLALGPAQAVAPDRSLLDMGMDSLMAMELRNRITGAVEVRIAVADLLEGPTTSQLAATIIRALPDAARTAPPVEREEVEL